MEYRIEYRIDQRGDRSGSPEMTVIQVKVGTVVMGRSKFTEKICESRMAGTC